MLLHIEVKAFADKVTVVNEVVEASNAEELLARLANSPQVEHLGNKLFWLGEAMS